MTKWSFPSIQVKFGFNDQQGFGTNLSQSIFVLRKVKLIKGTDEKASKEFLEMNKTSCQQQDKD